MAKEGARCSPCWMLVPSMAPRSEVVDCIGFDLVGSRSRQAGNCWWRAFRRRPNSAALAGRASRLQLLVQLQSEEQGLKRDGSLLQERGWILEPLHFGFAVHIRYEHQPEAVPALLCR